MTVGGLKGLSRVRLKKDEDFMASFPNKNHGKGIFIHYKSFIMWYNMFYIIWYKYVFFFPQFVGLLFSSNCSNILLLWLHGETP